MDNIQKEREEIIEISSVFILSLYIKFLSSKNYRVLIIDGCKSGLTFEALVKKLEPKFYFYKFKVTHNMEKIYYSNFDR
jgi:hypothetical protein